MPSTRLAFVLQLEILIESTQSVPAYCFQLEVTADRVFTLFSSSHDYDKSPNIFITSVFLRA